MGYQILIFRAAFDNINIVIFPFFHEEKTNDEYCLSASQPYYIKYF